MFDAYVAALLAYTTDGADTAKALLKKALRLLENETDGVVAANALLSQAPRLLENEMDGAEAVRALLNHMLILLAKSPLLKSPMVTKLLVALLANEIVRLKAFNALDREAMLDKNSASLEQVQIPFELTGMFDSDNMYAKLDVLFRMKAKSGLSPQFERACVRRKATWFPNMTYSYCCCI